MTAGDAAHDARMLLEDADEVLDEANDALNRNDIERAREKIQMAMGYVETVESMCDEVSL